MLKGHQIEMSDEQLTAFVRGNGKNPEKLTDAVVTALVNIAIAQKGSIVSSSQQSELASSEEGQKAAPVEPPKSEYCEPSNFQDAIANMGGQVSKEVTELTNPIIKGAKDYAQGRAMETLQVIADVPNLVGRIIIENAAEYKGNPDAFRTAGRAISKGIFGN